MRFLKEDLLLENIWDLKKYFPKIDDKKYLALIQLDPTYKGGDIAGTYAKWILSLANKDKLHNLGHVADVLSRFEENKRNLKNKDIMTFKSLEDLDNYLNDENSYKELSQRQELRQTQKAVRASDIEKDAELVYEDSDWKVYVPKTYEASCKLGQGTKWCTASTANDYYFISYSEDGPLYINIGKDGSKYQFHFESNQYMDADDRDIDLEAFFKDKPNLLKFYMPKIEEKLGGLDFNEDGYMIVNVDIDRLAEKLSDRDMSDNFLKACMTGDFYEIWDFYSEWYDADDIERYYFRDIDETNKAILAEHGINADNIKQALDEVDDLHSAISSAINDGYDIGSQNAALRDFNDAFNNASPFKFELADDMNSYNFYITNLNAISLIQYLDEYSIEGAICEKIADNFNFVEPHYGWQDFDEQAFNDRLNDSLTTEVF